jgi:hypothetical protein
VDDESDDECYEKWLPYGMSRREKSKDNDREKHDHTRYIAHCTEKWVEKCPIHILEGLHERVFEMIESSEEAIHIFVLFPLFPSHDLRLSTLPGEPFAGTEGATVAKTTTYL